jgi:hypothetical protein
MKKNFDRDQLNDIASHGADAGWSGLTYYSDTCRLYRKFSDEIWNLATEMSESMGNKHVLELIASFNGATQVHDSCTFENLLVWFAAEEIARQMTE